MSGRTLLSTLPAARLVVEDAGAQQRAATVRQRRGFVLIAVLVVVGAALLVTTGLLFAAQAEAAGAANATQRIQSRALARSGVKLITAELNRQRQAILDGGTPRLETQYEVYTSGSSMGIVRLLPLGPDGARLIPEAGRVDLNHADADALEATGLIDPDLAQRIITYRDARPGGVVRSVAELLNVDGITAEDLHGPLEDLTLGLDETADDALAFDRTDALGAASEPRGLADVLTVYAFEPALQRDGTLRINLNVPWSTELGRRLDDRFGEGTGAFVKQIMNQGTEFTDDGIIYRVLNDVGIDPPDWAEIDAITTDSGEYHFGRLDINVASYEALLALGLEAEQAAAIVRERDDLGPDERAYISWPAVREILPPEAYETVAGRMTVRSWTYRVRLATGEVDAEAPEGPLRNAVVYEAVVDLSDPTPRLAYLREVTMLETAAHLATALPAGASGGEPGDEAWDDDAASEPALDGSPATADDVMSADDAVGEGGGVEWADEDWSFDDDDASDGDGTDGNGGGGGGSADAANGAGSGGTRIGRWRVGG